jgi:hypothetical protein
MHPLSFKIQSTTLFSMIPTQNKATIQENEKARKPIKRHRLTPDEKATVIKLYEELGAGCWDKVQEVLQLKSKRTAREHFYKFILTDSKKPFTKEEDDLIIKKVKELGTRWTQIAKFFNNRSDINIRNRYRIISKNRDPNRKRRSRRTEQSSPELVRSPEVMIMVSPLTSQVPVAGPNERNIILDFHHFDIMTMKDMNSSSPYDFFSANCYKV